VAAGNVEEINSLTTVVDIVKIAIASIMVTTLAKQQIADRINIERFSTQTILSACSKHSRWRKKNERFVLVALADFIWFGDIAFQ